MQIVFHLFQVSLVHHNLLRSLFKHRSNLLLKNSREQVWQRKWVHEFSAYKVTTTDESVTYLHIFYEWQAKKGLILVRDSVQFEKWFCIFCLALNVLTLRIYWSFLLKISSLNVKKTAGNCWEFLCLMLNKEILNRKLHFLCSVVLWSVSLVYHLLWFN